MSAFFGRAIATVMAQVDASGVTRSGPPFDYEWSAPEEWRTEIGRPVATEGSWEAQDRH